ncbi:MAG TPA: cupin domain-containing protein [Candidatus Cybelea sp.]|nr:cupin domain-containing protein [Candidatus Cybelea sp.]
MKKLCLLFLFAIPFLVLKSQEPLPAGVEHWSPASLERTAQALAREAAADPHHPAVKQLSDYPNESFLLVHREADGQPEWHETQVDVFFVQSGSASLLVGGKLLNGETVAPHEKRNGTIQGGTRQKLSAGDVVRIPAGMPHQFLLEGARDFTYFVIKVKGY